VSLQIEFKRPYLDSSVYIAAISLEAGRCDIARQILEAADHGNIQIVASTWVAAEVIKMKGETEPLSLEREVEIDSIFQNKQITWVELDLNVAVEARHVARDHGLRPGDAVHLASAIRGNADVLLRWDGRFKGLPKIAGIDICDPYWYGPTRLPGIGTP
jgi:predicted nucleic acid-binding protein